MKVVSVLLFIFSTTFVHGQIPGSKIKGPITIFDTLEVDDGDILSLGVGSDPRSGDFVFVYQPANYLAGTSEQNLSRMMANTEVEIKHFKEYETKKIGKVIYTVVNLGGYNQIVELEGAIKSGEIIAINGIPIDLEKEEPKTVIIQNAPSKADELIKLKKLLDDGVLTQEEFDAEKKAILER